VGRFSEQLEDLLPVTGRKIKENGDMLAAADAEFLADLIDPTASVFRKRGFFWSDLRTSVAAGNVFYYAFTLSQTLHTVVYVRELSAGQGPVQLDNIVGGTWSGGTVDNQPINLFAGNPGSDMVITEGVTYDGGGVTIPIDYIFSAGNKSAVAGTAGLPTIFPPGVELLLKLTNIGLGTNPGIKLSLAFTELEIPNDLI
jgi:hypothetical protein